MIKNPLINILVISRDVDWKKAFYNENRISFCESIDEALKTIQSTEKLETIVTRCKNEILKDILLYAENEYYDLPGYELYNDSDVEISSLRVIDIDDFIPMHITSSSVLFKCVAHLSVDGSTRIIDEDRSYYDREDRKYYYIACSDISFRNGRSEIECEIKLDFSPDYENADVTDIKLIDKYGIDIELGEADISEEYCSDDELALEAIIEDHYR